MSGPMSHFEPLRQRDLEAWRSLPHEVAEALQSLGKVQVVPHHSVFKSGRDGRVTEKLAAFSYGIRGGFGLVEVGLEQSLLGGKTSSVLSWDPQGDESQLGFSIDVREHLAAEQGRDLLVTEKYRHLERPVGAVKPYPLTSHLYLQITPKGDVIHEGTEALLLTNRELVLPVFDNVMALMLSRMSYGESAKNRDIVKALIRDGVEPGELFEELKAKAFARVNPPPGREGIPGP